MTLALSVQGENGHNHQAECAVLSRIPPGDIPIFFKNKVCPEYAAILPLRMFRLKSANASVWLRVQGLMDHLDKMDGDEVLMWKGIVIQFLQKTCNFTECSEKDVMRYVGILGTNGVNQGMMLGHGLYPTFSFISHR